MKIPKKIAIIGNGGGGKTTLAKRFSKQLGLPVVHVDSIQFLAGFKKREECQTRSILNKVAVKNEWIIDGFGPMDVISKRVELADKIVFIDFPLWRHLWWATKRQMMAFWKTRSELPSGCSERSLAHTIRLFKVIIFVDKNIRPKLINLFEKPENSSKMVRVKSIESWKNLYQNGL